MDAGTGALIVNVVNLINIAIVVVMCFAFYDWVVFPSRQGAHRRRYARPQRT